MLLMRRMNVQGGEFVIAGRNPAELLEPCEEALDNVAVAVLVAIEVALGGSISFRRDHCLCLFAGDVPDQRIGVIGFIGQHCGRFDVIEQCLGLRDVVNLSAGQGKSCELAKFFNACMNLGGQPTPRTSKSLLPFFLAAPAACWCARTTVLSMKTSAKSASSRRTAKMLCQTFLSAQRANRT